MTVSWFSKITLAAEQNINTLRVLLCSPVHVLFEHLWSKTLSAPSFGHYEKLLTCSPYSKVCLLNLHFHLQNQSDQVRNCLDHQLPLDLQCLTCGPLIEICEECAQNLHSGHALECLDENDNNSVTFLEELKEAKSAEKCHLMQKVTKYFDAVHNKLELEEARAKRQIEATYAEEMKALRSDSEKPLTVVR